MSLKSIAEYDYIRKNYFDPWFQNGGCDGDNEEAFWQGYETCKSLNDGIRQAVDEEIEEMTNES